MSIRKPYRISDGNGGHLWDRKLIKEKLMSGLVLVIIIPAISTALNWAFSTQDIKKELTSVKMYMLRSLQMNEIQNKQINSNTGILYKHVFPNVPPPLICWPESEVKQ